MMRRVTAVLLMMIAVALSMPPVSQATLIGHCAPGVESPQLGFCHKEVSLSGSTLTIKLTNTSPLGGFIVADAFDLPTGVTATLSSATNTNFNFFGGSSFSVSPFGTRNQILTLASLNNKGELTSPFEGAGGNPSAGIAPADGEETFVFTLAGTGTTEAGIIGSELIRFKGFSNDKSDKTPISLDEQPEPTPEPVPTPEPSSLLLVGSGLAGFARVIARRRRR